VFPADLSQGSEAGSESPYGTNQMMIQRTVFAFFLSVNSGLETVVQNYKRQIQNSRFKIQDSGTLPIANCRLPIC
jgi:hypothetical protein